MVGGKQNAIIAVQLQYGYKLATKCMNDVRMLLLVGFGFLSDS